ncbi:MAG: DUF1015 domain-containing protein [Thermoplasmata archaeon]|nr:DUF1015 domain-containing protein [Thermoplasmata archaeon]
MVMVRAFRGLRPMKEHAEMVASPPYDVLDSNEAREIVKANPMSFLRVIKPEVGLDEDVDLYSEPVYDKGASNLKQLIDDGIMVQDEKPMYYFYRQVMGDHSQVGLVATVSAEDYENNLIKRHEFTKPDKETDRVRHIMTQKAQCGPVFLTYPDVEVLNNIQKDHCLANEPFADFVSDDGIRHVFWLVCDQNIVGMIKSVFEAVPCLYVADGHHRSAAGTVVARNLRKENPDHTGKEEYNFFLAVIFPESNMKILAYNRAVEDLNALSKEEFLVRVSEKFQVSQHAGKEPKHNHSYSMYLDGEWFGLEPEEGTYPADDPVKSLDASILQENLLAPILGIEDPRTSQRIKFIGGIRGTEELEMLVDSGKFQVAFSMYPTSIEELMKVADSGNVMPPKSTWFEPKLRSGLVVHLI